MANTIFYQQTNMSDTSSYPGYVASATNSAIRINSETNPFGKYEIYTGAFNFTGNNITSGIVYSYTFYNTVFQNNSYSYISSRTNGLNLDVLKVNDYLVRLDTIGLFAYAFNGADSFLGSPNNDVILSFNGNDSITGNGGNDFLDGGTGVDTAAYAGAALQYSIQTNSANWTVSDKMSNRDGTDTLTSIERLKFIDMNVALDVRSTDNAGSVYMLYKAAFNRPSDNGGMGYWIAQKDGGANLVTSIAQGFVNSAEFTAKYGASPTNTSYVNNLYQNVLGRAGEAGGVAYWIGEMDAGRVSKAAALVQFATLPEGAGNVAPLIANGIQYQEWLG